MADPHNRVQFSGTMPGGEVWSMGCAYQENFGSPVTTFADLTTWATAIAALNSGSCFPAQILSKMSTALTLSKVRTEYYGASGALAQAAEYIFPAPVSGSGSPTKPFQASIAVSLLTGRPGRSYRGRMYLPAQGTAITTTTLRIGSTDTNAVATSMATFIKAVGTAAPAGTAVLPAVYSHKLGTLQAITAVSVGDVMDVQRRRRDSLAELYTVIAL